jgi:hypothetical protein
MKKRAKRIYQCFAILLSLVMIAIGLKALIAKGDMFYGNWWGGLVFAPLTIIGGVWVIFLVIFRWDKMMKTK